VWERGEGVLAMVVDVLAGDGGGGGDALCGLLGGATGLELGEVGFDVGFGSLGVFMVNLAVFRRDYVVSMLLRESLLMGDGLHGGVGVVLVDLAVDRLGCLFMTMRLDGLLCHSRSDCLVHMSRVTLVGGEVGNGFLGSLHYGWRGLAWCDAKVLNGRWFHGCVYQFGSKRHEGSRCTYKTVIRDITTATR
jgi:hypothetical protein